MSTKNGTVEQMMAAVNERLAMVERERKGLLAFLETYGRSPATSVPTNASKVITARITATPAKKLHWAQTEEGRAKMAEAGKKGRRARLRNGRKPETLIKTIRDVVALNPRGLDTEELIRLVLSRRQAEHHTHHTGAYVSKKRIRSSLGPARHDKTIRYDHDAMVWYPASAPMNGTASVATREQWEAGSMAVEGS